MSLITGEITREGPILLVGLGVSRNRARKLTEAGFAVPALLPFRVLLDTGSNVSAFAPTAFPRLGLKTPFGRIAIRTPSTRRGQPCLCDWYDVSLTLASGMTTKYLPSIQAIASEDFDESEEVQGILGRDVLDRCTFYYHGLDKQFTLAFIPDA